MRTLAVAAVLALVAVPAPGAIPAADVTARAISGQAYEGFIVAPGDVHSFLLEDFAPQTVSIALKAGKGSTLLPDLALFDAGETDITANLAPFRKDGAKSVAVKNCTALSNPGRFTLQVTGKTGTTGSYLLKVTAKVVKKFKGTGIVESPSTASFIVFAPTEALVSLKVVKGTGSTLVPEFVGLTGSLFAAASVAPSATPGVGTFTCPLTGDWTVEVGGDGGTGGVFNWSAKVKPAKVSKKPVRVNGGAPFFADPGPAPGIETAKAGQTVFGFGVDALGLCWREVRTSGGGPNGGKNSIQCTTLKGGKLPSPANNFITDLDPDPRAFAVAPTHLAVFDFTAGELLGVARNGSGETVLNDTLGTVGRLLGEGDSAFALRNDGIRRYAFDGSVSTGVSTDAAYTYLDMAIGAIGVVFAAEDGSGNLVIAMVDRDAGGFLPLTTLSPNPGLQALAARGTDVFFAVDDGSGGSTLYRVSAYAPGPAVPLCPGFAGPVTAMAADELNAYALEDDAEDGVRLRQIPRGGGESIVLYRGSGSASFTIAPGGIGAAGGYVFVQAVDGGSDAFYRVKRR